MIARRQLFLVACSFPALARRLWEIIPGQPMQNHCKAPRCAGRSFFVPRHTPRIARAKRERRNLITRQRKCVLNDCSVYVGPTRQCTSMVPRKRVGKQGTIVWRAQNNLDVVGEKKSCPIAAVTVIAREGIRSKAPVLDRGRTNRWHI